VVRLRLRPIEKEFDITHTEGTTLEKATYKIPTGEKIIPQQLFEQKLHKNGDTSYFAPGYPPSESSDSDAGSLNLASDNEDASSLVKEGMCSVLDMNRGGKKVTFKRPLEKLPKKSSSREHLIARWKKKGRTTDTESIRRRRRSHSQ